MRTTKKELTKLAKKLDNYAQKIRKFRDNLSSLDLTADDLYCLIEDIDDASHEIDCGLSEILV